MKLFKNFSSFSQISLWLLANLSCVSFIQAHIDTIQSQELISNDRYSFLEDSDNPQTQEWLEKQKKLFNHYIQSNPYRGLLKENLKKLINHESYSIPMQRGEYYFFTKIEPSEDQYVLYFQKGLNGIPRRLIDPNELSKQNPVNLCDFVPSPDSKHLAYGLSENGSDSVVWQVLDIESGKNESDRLEKIKFTSVVWSPDSKGFYYSRFETQVLHKIYYHALGTPQSADKLIYEDLENPNLFYELASSSDGQYLIISASKGASSPAAIFCIDLNDPNYSVIKIFADQEANHTFISNRGKTFYFLTDKEASNRKLISVDISQPSRVERDIIAEGKCVIDELVSVGDYFLASFLDNVCNRLSLYDREGNWVRNITLPDQGVIELAKSEHSSLEGSTDEIFFTFSNFLKPKLIYRYSLKADKLDIFKQPNLAFDPNQFTSQQVFYKSKDGTKVPMFIVHKKGIKLDGNNPTLLYGYGGFNLAVYPSYNAFNILWMENGGVYVLANIRGGSEYGDNWHKQGMKHCKQNCFDDFIAAGEWLIANHYTKPSKLAIRGRSNGGLLTAACLNQRPDLFGAALVEVGVLDMLRFHLFSVGHFWMSEYGDPNDPKDYAVLRKYSPYHNIQSSIKYPPTLIITADYDDRVVPLHSFKYTAALQEAQKGNDKILLRIETQSGHGAGKPVSKWVDESTDVLAFLMQELEETKPLGSLSDEKP